MTTRENVLALLESNRERVLSGEDIARRLGLSRAAVWKAVAELRKRGYEVDATCNHGYQLSADCDILSAQGIAPYLRGTTAPYLIKCSESLESTNTTAKKAAISGAEHGTVIVADCQTGGKGRFGRQFYSPRGRGLYMSVLLRPSNSHVPPALATARAAVAVCEAIEETAGKFPQIKWVNDVYLNGGKICGILTEAATDFESGGVQWLVVGIGVNFTAPPEGYPADIRGTAAALFAEPEKPPITRNRLAGEIISRLLPPAPPPADLLARYKSRLLTLGRTVAVSGLDGGTFSALATEIDESGRLIVQKESGEILALSSGEVSLGQVRHV